MKLKTSTAFYAAVALGLHLHNLPGWAVALAVFLALPLRRLSPPAPSPSPPSSPSPPQAQLATLPLQHLRLHRRQRLRGAVAEHRFSL